MNIYYGYKARITNIERGDSVKDLNPLLPLTNAREGLGLTQEQLAKKAKLSRPMLSHIERGAATPSLPVAYRIAKALNKTIEEIFFNHKARKMNKTA